MKNLEGARCYLIGPMEFRNGQAWRERMTTELHELGVKVFDPYNKPFVDIDYSEDDQTREKLNSLRENDLLDELHSLMKKIRASDLRLVDISDFFIAYYNTEVHTCGSIEELVTANRAKKPVMIVVEGGHNKAPLWLYGMFPPECFYSSFESVMDTLYDIHEDKIELDKTRWHLLRKEYV